MRGCLKIFALFILTFLFCRPLYPYSPSDEHKFVDGDNFTLHFGQIAVIRDIWQEPDLKNFTITVAIKKSSYGVRLEVVASTFGNKEVAVTRLLTTGQHLLIEHGRGTATKITLKKLYVNKAELSLDVEEKTGPLEPKLALSFYIEID